MLLGVEVNLFLFPEEVWARALLQAQERYDQQEQGKVKKRKRQKKGSMAKDIYDRTQKSYFDVAMANLFGGTPWLSQREKHD